MTNQTPKHILCAVRGQPESRDTATRAIDLALAYNARLTFILVLVPPFPAHATPTMNPLRLVYQQLEDIGEFSMLILCDRAQRRGVNKVDYEILKGKVPDQLIQAAIKSEADIMVLGSPLNSAGHNVFSKEEFTEFVTDLETKANIKVVKVPH